MDNKLITAVLLALGCSIKYIKLNIYIFRLKKNLLMFITFIINWVTYFWVIWKCQSVILGIPVRAPRWQVKYRIPSPLMTAARSPVQMWRRYTSYDTWTVLQVDPEGEAEALWELCSPDYLEHFCSCFCQFLFWAEFSPCVQMFAQWHVVIH